MDRIPKLSANLFLMFMTIVVILGALEVSARAYLFWLAPEHIFLKYASYGQLQSRFGPAGNMYSSHPYLGYYPNPNYVKGDNRHNSLGYRGEEIAIPKPAPTFRIVCIGGSTTYTTRVADYRKAYPHLLQTKLRERGFDNIEVINAGVAGWTTWESLINFEFRLLDLEPDMIIVYHAVNDVGPRIVWPPEAYRGDNTGARRAGSQVNETVDIIKYSTLGRMFLIKFGLARPNADLAAVAEPATTSYSYAFDAQMWSGTYPSDFFTQVSVEQMLESNQPIYYRRNLENLIALAKSRNIDVVLATFAHLKTKDHELHSSWDSAEYRSALSEHNEILKQLAQENDVSLFDFANVFPEDENYYAVYHRYGRRYVDQYHVNKSGADLKAELFAEHLDQNLFAME